MLTRRSHFQLLIERIIQQEESGVSTIQGFFSKYHPLDSWFKGWHVAAGTSKNIVSNGRYFLRRMKRKFSATHICIMIATGSRCRRWVAGLKYV
jgi:hypothetical protein